MKAASLGWSDGQDLEEKRRLRKALGISLAAHLGLALALILSPSFSIKPIPQSIAVELVAAPRMGPPAAPKTASRKPPAARRPPPPKAPPAAKPTPKPAPEQPAPPKPKVAKVLPENEPQPDRKVKQTPEKKPKEVAKAEPKRAEKPAEKVVEREPEESQSYEDVMKELEADDGDDALDEVLEATARPAARTASESTGAATSRRGVRLDPRMAAWMEEATRLIRSKWVTPSNFRGRGLVTHLELELSASGVVQGEPTVVRGSEDPYFDDTAVAALISVGRLPPPPPGVVRVPFEFSSDEEY